MELINIIEQAPMVGALLFMFLKGLSYVEKRDKEFLSFSRDQSKPLEAIANEFAKSQKDTQNLVAECSEMLGKTSEVLRWSVDLLSRLVPPEQIKAIVGDKP